MDLALRSRFNADFTPHKYAALLSCVNETERWPADFRISETPIFLTREFTQEVEDHGYGLVTFFKAPGDFAIQLYQPKYTK